jgi:hypothetical protein
MLDIETLGTNSNSVIIQVGLAMFERNTGIVGNKTLINVSIDSCLKKGLVVSGSTIAFWLMQEGRSFLDKPITLDTALNQIKSFYQRESMIGKNDIFTWCHTNFDAPILSNAFDKCDIKSPFPYKNFRDIRTLTDLTQLDIKKTFENKTGPQKTHNALDDCLFQIKYCRNCFETFVEKKAI